MLYAAWPPLVRVRVRVRLRLRVRVRVRVSYPNPNPNQAASVLFALARGPLSLPGALMAWTAFTSVHLARLLTFTRRLHLRVQQEQRTAARRSD